MAKAALKGLTVKIGGDTSDLLDSLKDVEKQGKSLSSELGQINKLLKLDPKNTELLAQKQKVLADAVANTEKKLGTLREAEKQAQEQFKKGEISEQQYRALQREIIETENKLKSYERAVQETADEQKRLADSADDVADEMDDQADKTREAGNAADDMDDSANSLAAGGLAAMAAAAVGAVTAIVALAEETREYRNEMAKLDTAFQTSGFTSEAATKTYEALQSVLGETEQAVEAANHLAKLCTTEEDLAKWTDIATGVYATFGASLPIEGLTEAANETARTGALTGGLADALNWAALEGETFGVTMKGNTAASADLGKTISATEAKLGKLKATEKQNKEQLEAAKTAVAAVKKEITATESELSRYQQAVSAAGGANADTIQTMSELETRLAQLKEKERQAQATLEESQTASKNAASQLKDEIKATNAQLSGYKKAAKDATGPTEEWNKKVEEAATAEDYFNLALEQCSTQQERQQLITQTLAKMYGKAGDEFRETNKEIIRANQATEKWNKATAKIGKAVEPVMTDIKELGVVLLEDAQEPLEDTAEFIREDVIPAIKDISKWVKNNGPLIKSTLVGIGTAMVAFKVATIATTVAQKGFKGALMASTVAQKALNLAQAATPWGLVATGIAGVVAILGTYILTSEDSAEAASILTDEEKELVKAADEAAEAFREQRAATDEALGNVTAEMNHVQELADELRGLADASGKVKDSDKARADFIIKELNDALGTEYKMTGNVINNYKELKKNIDEVIKSKLANSLMDKYHEDYLNAIEGKAGAYDSMMATEKQYQDSLTKTNQLWDEYAKVYDEYNTKLAEYNAMALDDPNRSQKFQEMEALVGTMREAAQAWGKQKHIMEEHKKVYDEDVAHYNSLMDTILTYESAQESALKGNYDTAVGLLAKKSEAHKKYTDVVDEETAKVIGDLEEQAIEAGKKAEWTKEQFGKGVAGFGQEMVDSADKKYKEALDKFATAYSDALGVGKEFSQGIADGIKIKDGAVGAAAISQIREAVKAAKKAAEINSPSRVTRREVGAGLGEGNAKGIEDTTPDVEKAAEKQMDAVLNVYRTEEVDAQRALRTVADQQVARQTSVQMSAAATYNGVLDRILAAIEKGQVLTIDGETLVGATALAMDNALGRRRDLAARGAL